MAVNFLSDAIINGSLTVTSGTSGDATLIISADTDNSEEADSPRLWFKADGDIIEGAIQHKDNTFDFISNVSSSGGFRFLTGITNNTGTTDPETGATEKMRITPSGNIGIGTTSPDTLLEVSKSTGAAVRITSTATGNGADVTLGSLEYYGNDASVPGAGIKSSIVAKTEASLGDDSNLIFSTSDGTTNNIERLRINSSGDVGIGQTDPQTLLHLTTAMSSSPTTKLYLDVDGTNTNGGGGEIIFNTSASAGSPTLYNAKITGTRASGGIGGDSQIGFWTTLVSSSTSPQERMTITKEGNVGIGTTSPDSKLHVYGTSNPVFKVEDDGGAYGFMQAAGSNQVYVGSGPSADLSFYAGLSSAMTILASNKNVGIGTTSPDEKLEVVGALRLHDGTDQGTILFRGDRDDVYIKEDGYALTFGAPSGIEFEMDSNNNDSDYFDVMHRGTSRFYIDGPTGEIGIGTTSPTKILDVNGDTNITGTLDITTSSPTGSPLVRFYQTTTRRGFIQMADTNDNLRVASEYGSVSLEAAATSGVDSDTSYIRIQPGGTVEIGAVDGDATITTDGNMTFRTDTDNDETSQKFSFQSNNPATEVASISDTGALSITTIELGNASDTTIARASAGKVTIEGAPIQTTQMSMSHHNFYFNTTSTTVDYFVPFNNLTESSNPTTTNYYGRMVAPYDGRIVKAVINTTAAIGTACQVLFWVATSSGTFAPSAAETVTGVNLNTANSSATATFSTTSTAEFDEGDVLGVSIIKSGTTSTAYIQVTIVWEYTV